MYMYVEGTAIAPVEGGNALLREMREKVCMYIYVCIYKYVYLYMYVCLCILICTYIYMFI